LAFALNGFFSPWCWQACAVAQDLSASFWETIGTGRQLLQDIGIALGFWIVASALLWICGWVLQIHGNNPAITAMLPHGALEVVLWIVPSVTAGIAKKQSFGDIYNRSSWR
jgi:hypothetical protein